MRWNWVLALSGTLGVATVGGCGGDDSDGTCGDTVCNGGETCASCPGDCGECTECTVHSQCDADSLCLYDRCELAWGRTYTVTVLDGHIPERDPETGACWDDPCGAPDSQVTVTLSGTPHTTAEQSDTYSPRWDYRFTDMISATSTMTADMVDVDLVVDDPMFSWAAFAITIDDLKNGGIQLHDATGAFVLVNIVIAPVL